MQNACVRDTRAKPQYPQKPVEPSLGEEIDEATAATAVAAVAAPTTAAVASEGAETADAASEEAVLASVADGPVAAADPVATNLDETRASCVRFHAWLNSA